MTCDRHRPSGQAVVAGVFPCPSPPERAFIFIAHRLQHSLGLSIFIVFLGRLTLPRFPQCTLEHMSQFTSGYASITHAWQVVL